MGKKSGPAPPPTPDPYAVADAQSQYNREAAIAQANINRIDQVSPWGQVTYEQIGTHADGTPQYRQTTTLTAEQQALLNSQNQVGMQLGELATQQIGRVQDATSAPFNFDGMTPMVTSVPGASDVSRFEGQTPGVNRNVQSGPLQYNFNSGPQITRNFNTGGPLATGADGWDIQRGVGPDDFSADARRVSDAVFGQAASRLDPQFAQAQSDLEAKLVNQGIAVGSDAYNREMDNFGRSRTDAYNDAVYRAIQAGGAEQSRLFGLDLSAGQFANAAQAQGFGQDWQNATLNNAAMAQLFGQNLQGAQFLNSAQAQQYAQNQGLAMFYNAARDQQFASNLASAELYNNAGQMDFSQQLAALGFNNQANSQQFNQEMANANLTNNARQQEINEATYLRNLPLNDIAALMGTSGGVQQPQFTPFAQSGVAAPDYMGAAYNSANMDQQQYYYQQQQQAAAYGSIFGLAGTIGGAAVMSDRRVKENVKRIGKLANGLATYAFNYIGDTVRRFGVMAQEVVGVRPDAVVITPNGYMAVDYRKVW
jgi:hypothetical protein